MQELYESLFPLLPKFGHLFLAGLIFMPYLAGAMLPFFTTIGLTLGSATGRKFYTLAAKQTTSLISWFNWYAFFSCASAYFVFFTPKPELEPYVILLVMAGACLLIGSLLTSLLEGLWSKLRPIRLLLTLVAWLCIQAGFLLGISLLYLHYIQKPLPMSTGLVLELSTWQTFYPEFFLSLAPALTLDFAIIISYLICLEITLAGSLALCWLLWRRNKDDFGRDYYVHATHFISLFTSFGAWISLILLGWLSTNPLQNGQHFLNIVPDLNLILLFTTLTLTSIVAILHSFLAKISHPMRFKLGIITAPLLMVCGMACTALVFLLS